MLPVSFAGALCVMIFALLWYVFRPESERNPVWGNVIATGLNVFICILLGFSFLTGGIMSERVITNATYTVDFNGLSSTTISNITANATARQYVLGGSGTGMYTIASVDSNSRLAPYLSNFVVTYFSHDIIYTQIQDWSMSAILFALAFINAALLTWFIYTSEMLDVLLNWGEWNREEQDEV